jgi:hypothetical protein
MNRMYLRAIFCLALGPAFIGVAASKDRAKPRDVDSAGCALEVCEYSAYRVIVSPDQFEGKTILIRGVLMREFDEWVLYINNDSADLGAYADSFQLVSITKKSKSVVIASIPAIDPELKDVIISGGRVHVLVIGVFSVRTYGGAGLRAGSIDVSSLQNAMEILRQ